MGVDVDHQGRDELVELGDLLTQPVVPPGQGPHGGLAPCSGSRMRVLSGADREQIDTLPDGRRGLPQAAGAVEWWRSGSLVGEALRQLRPRRARRLREQRRGRLRQPPAGQPPGDEVALTDGDVEQRYRIVSLRDVPKASLASGTDTISQKVAGRLLLLTRTGCLDPQTRHYDENLVVTADPLGLPTRLP